MTAAPKKRAQNGFVTPLQVESVDPFTWALLGDLVWVGSAGDVITVPAGFTTDFASVPQVLQSIVPRTGAWTKAAVVHDYLWRTDDHVFDNVETDAVFEKIMIEDNVPRWKASIMWAAVRWGALVEGRRDEWWSTFDRLIRITLVFALVVVLIATGWYLLVDLTIEALL